MAQNTRERILDVARELFTDQGYDVTSLREIADRLGFTKAALYYHFQSKEQILQALLAPIDGVVDEFLGRLEAAEGLEEWGEVLAWVIGQMELHLPLFRLLQRNRISVEQFGGWNESDSSHMQMHERLEQAVRAKTSSLREQVRMIAALGAVTAFDDWAPELMTEAPMPQLAIELTAVVRDVLGLPPAGDAASDARGAAAAPVPAKPVSAIG
jgi:AcrR family transcriptional regulator